MLLNMRDKMEGWIKWLIVLVLIAVFALWGISYYLEGNAAAANAGATVNGKPIDQSMVQKVYEQLLHQVVSSGGRPDVQHLQKLALEQVIDQTLLQQEAATLGMHASPTMINQIITNLTPFQEKGSFSVSKFEQILSTNGMTVQSYKQTLKQAILNQQIKFGLFESDFILPQVLENYRIWLAQERTFKVADVPYQQFVSKVKIQPQQISDYYHAHLEKFKVPAKVQIEYVLLAKSALEKTVKYSSDDLKAYYQSHLNQYRTPEARQIKLQSADNSAPEIKWLTFDPQNELSKAVFSLKAVGDKTATQPVATLLAIKAPEQKTFEEVEQAVKKDFIEMQASQQYQTLQSQLANITASDTTTLKSVQKALDLKVRTSQFFTEKGVHKGIAQYPNVIRAAFSDAVLNDKMNSQPISLPNDQVVVLRVKSYQSAKEQSLEKVHSEIVNTLTQQAAAKLAVGYAQKQVKAFKVGNVQSGLTWKIHKDISRLDQTLPHNLLAAVFEQFIPQNDKGIWSYVNIPEKQKVYIFQLQKVNNSAELPKEITLKDLEAVLDNNEQTMLGGQLLAYLKKQATIKIGSSAGH